MDPEIIKYKTPKKKYLSKEVTKFLLSGILLLSVTILYKKNTSFKDYISNTVLKDSIVLTKCKEVYDTYIGSTSSKTLAVMQEENLEESIPYGNGEKISSGEALLLESGIIVYLGDKDSLGSTCIIQGVDGVEIWYSHISLEGLTLYDYKEKGTQLSSLDNYYIRTIVDNDTYLTYEDYQNRS